MERVIEEHKAKICKYEQKIYALEKIISNLEKDKIALNAFGIESFFDVLPMEIMVYLVKLHNAPLFFRSVNQKFYTAVEAAADYSFGPAINSFLKYKFGPLNVDVFGWYQLVEKISLDSKLIALSSLCGNITISQNTNPNSPYQYYLTFIGGKIMAAGDSGFFIQDSIQLILLRKKSDYLMITSHKTVYLQHISLYFPGKYTRGKSASHYVYEYNSTTPHIDHYCLPCLKKYRRTSRFITLLKEGKFPFPDPAKFTDQELTDQFVGIANVYRFRYISIIS